jgi:hypothetical protein
MFSSKCAECSIAWAWSVRVVCVACSRLAMRSIFIFYFFIFTFTFTCISQVYCSIKAHLTVLQFLVIISFDSSSNLILVEGCGRRGPPASTRRAIHTHIRCVASCCSCSCSCVLCTT